MSIRMELKTRTEIVEIDSLSYNAATDTLARSIIVKFENKEINDLMLIKSIFNKGSKAELLFDDCSVFTGIIADVLPYYENKKSIFALRINSAISKYCEEQLKQGKHYINQKVSEIILDICPDIVLDIEKDMQLPKFITYSTDTVDEVIAKLAVISGIVIYSGFDGKLKLTEYKDDSEPVGLIEDNILDLFPVTVVDDDITIIGQNSLDDNLELDKIVCPKLEVPGQIKKCIYVDSVSQSILESLENKKKILPLKITDWYDIDGNLLDINKTIKVKNAWIDVDEVFLIKAFTLENSVNNGYSAFLRLEARYV